MPNLVVAVFRHEQRTVRELSNPNGAAPDLTLSGVHHPAAEELFGRAVGLSAFEGDENNVVADAFRAVAGAALRDEGAITVA